ncbi:MAG: T9SS type A sorting domain-containing protein [Bacteroidales bacterium]|nr:T9SS type A sorting domain-containing protein [Bacteroidales bacterium]
MKKYLSILFCIAPLLGYAQPVLTSASHGYMPETCNKMQSVEYLSPGDAGTQVIWDFKQAIPTAELTLIKEDISLSEDRNILITNKEGVKFSYSCDGQSNIFKGYRGNNYSLMLDLPIKKMSYPFSYGHKLSGNFSGRILYDNSSLEFNRAGSFSTEADAVGTLVMPDGQVLKNVLRVKFVEKYIEKACSDVDVNLVKYAWYIEEYRYPVFVIFEVTYSYPDGKVTAKNTAYVTTATLNQVADTPVYESETPPTVKGEQAEIEHVVYPNPYSDNLHITYTLPQPVQVSISLYSLSGQLVSEIVSGKLQEGVQHVTYTPKRSEITGTYYLRLQFGNKVYVRALVKNY